MKRLKIIAGTILTICSLVILGYPDIMHIYQNGQMKKLEKEFPDSPIAGDASDHPEEPNEERNREHTEFDILTGTEELWSYIQRYNQELFQSGQAGFIDAWAAQQAPEGFSDISDQIFGYIKIPVMKVTLPLYLGASPEHMAKGAVVLGETSLPVGGESANSVIAAHRGYRGLPFFRDIENLSIGDRVELTNPWETLEYRVESIAVIDPYENDAVKIQEGRDLLTLMTCHPYRSHGKYRYLVYCNRIKYAGESTVQDANELMSADHPDSDREKSNMSSMVDDSSRFDILLETVIRRGCCMVILLIFLLSFIKHNMHIKKVRERKENI